MSLNIALGGSCFVAFAKPPQDPYRAYLYRDALFADPIVDAQAGQADGGRAATAEDIKKENSNTNPGPGIRALGFIARRPDDETPE